MAAKYQLATLGCKVNQYETEQVREVLESIGFRPVERGQRADLAVVNTCAVTSTALAKSRQAIRRLAGKGQTPVIVIGCGAAADRERLREIAGVLAVIGHDVDVAVEIRKLLVDRLDHAPTPGADGPLGSQQPVSPRQPAGKDQVWMRPPSATRGHHNSARPPKEPTPAIIPTALPIVNTLATLGPPISGFFGHQRAFLKVQDGCDAFCTYCIIPRLRPTLRSKSVDDAVAEARELVRAGHKEIVVTGIFLGAYGRETALRRRFDRRTAPLNRLLAALAGVDGLERLRLSSLEPGDVDDALLDVLAAHDVCVPHLHLPLQSGSADVLRRMNRQYNLDDYEGMIDRVRSRLDRPAISTDIIVGFPGETDADFDASVNMAKKVGFCKIHIFPFSPREHTAAARWHRQFVAAPVVKERKRRLADVERDCSLDYRRQFLGEVERVIVEGEGAFDGAAAAWQAMRRGRADRYFEVYFEAEGLLPGEVADVRIDRITPDRTHGTYLPRHARTLPLSVLPAQDATTTCAT